MDCNFKELGTDPGDLDDREDPALAVGIGGEIVHEELNIVEVCQDPDHINIVYILADVHGVFDYTPQLLVFYLDENDEEKEVDASSALIFNYKGSPNSIQNIPFSTACGSDSIIFAYDIANFVPNFTTLYKMTIVLKLGGTFDSTRFDFLQDFPELYETVGVFESENPEDSIVFVKGISAKPYKLYYDPETGELRLQFYTVGTNKCICNITCADVVLLDQDLNSCEDEVQEVIVNTNSLVGDPTRVNIVIRDSIGNNSDLSYQILLGVTPTAPSVGLHAFPNRMEVLPFFSTATGKIVDPETTQYQIWRYVNSPGSAKLIVDWTTKSFKSFSDLNIHSGNSYGYSIRFRGEFQEVSNFSSWTEVETR